MATINGTAGDDADLAGTSASDVINAGDGDDYLHDELGGNDQLHGEGGNDFMEVYREGAMAASTILLDGGAGNDFMQFDCDNRYSDTVTALGGIGDDNIAVRAAAVATIDAGDGADRITIDNLGTSRSVTLGDGADVLTLLSTGATISPLATITITDFLTGAAGDRLQFINYLDPLLQNWDHDTNPFATGHMELVPSGSDTLLKVDFDGPGTGAAAVTLINFQNTTKTSFTAANLDGVPTDGSAPEPRTLIGSAVNNTLRGGWGDDLLQGLDGKDTLRGLAGGDRLEGGNGADNLDGGGGDDLLFGGGDNDVLVDTLGGDDQLFGEAGFDTIQVNRSGSGPGTTILIDSGIDGGMLTFLSPGRMLDTVTIVGGDQTAMVDFIDVTGGLAVTVDARGGDDRVNVNGEGNVTIDGGEGADVFTVTANGSGLFTGLVTLTELGPEGDQLKFNGFFRPITLIQRGADAVFQIDPDGVAGGPQQDLVVIRNTAASQIGYNATDDAYYFAGSGSATGGDDVLVGDGNANNLNGLGGNDRLYGNGGNDHLDGGTGRDRLEGAAGDDTYFVDGFDTVIELAGNGNDSVYARESFALAAGSEVELLATADYRLTTRIDLTGNELNNAIIGSNGVNVLRGGGGGDTLRGLDGADILDGGDGIDQLIGGTGNDSYYVTNGDRVIELAGEGSDRVYARETFALAAGSAVEVLATADYRVTDRIDLTGNEYNNSITGSDGVNVLRGGGGGDTLRGLAGTDTLDGGAGTDLLIGGTENDNYYVTNGDQVIENAGEGFDSVYAHETFTLKAGSAVEVLATADYRLTGRLDLIGNELANTITGNNGVNLLYGRDGNDVLRGLDGNDTLDGGAGNDRLEGGLGNDNYYVDTGDTVVELAGEGSDSVYARASFTLGSGSAVELLATADYRLTHALDLTGNDLVNSVIGNNGTNYLQGLGGNDVLRGLAGTDSLDGGLGADTLYGGDGQDYFYFTTPLGNGNVDAVADFQKGTDGIVLNGGVFQGIPSGAPFGYVFVEGTSAQDADDRLIYDQATGCLFYDGDGNGAEAQLLFATFTPGTNLDWYDFLVI